MKSTIIISLVGATSIALVSCKNPVDKVTAAQVNEAQEITENMEPSGQKWSFTEDSTITFVGAKVTGSHDGGFKAFSGHFYVDGDKLSQSGHEVLIDMTSTYSDDEKLTGHLKSADFFDVENHPQTTFVATGLEPVSGQDGATHTLTGNFTLRGVTKEISFPVTVNQSAEKITIQSAFSINRKDFNIVYPGKTDDLIRDKVAIKLDLTAAPAEKK